MDERTEAPTEPRHLAEDGGNGEVRTTAPDGPGAPGRRRRWPWLVVGSLAVVVVAIVAGWAIDTSSGGVPRNVRLAGVDVGGVAQDDLTVRVTAIAEDFEQVPVEIVAGERTYRTTAAELGLEVDRRASSAAALDVDGQALFVVRPVVWVTSFFSERQADLVLRVNESVTRTAVMELEGEDRVPPTEPSVELDEDGFVLVSGEPGSGLDPARVAAALPRSAGSVTDPIQVTVRTEPIPPLGTDEDARAALDRAAALTGSPLEVRTPAASAEIGPEVLRSFVTLRSDPEEGIQVALDPDAVTAGLEAALPDIDGGPVDASFTVEGDQVRIIPDQDGVVCCDDSSAERIIAALEAGEQAVDLELRQASAGFRVADAEALGIVEEIGSPEAFGPTTRHACCESRVQNIQRMADLVRGVVIRPGETLSLNDHVGERTVEKGFAPGGVIINGRFSTAVGGGVSQFATTMFNAALFGGLDFEAYQSHSIYISRYPRGHEATINFPNVDLAVTNTTPYGVLVWPEYTDTSITVRLFSTRHAAVEVGAPTSSPAGRCTRWTTPRTRTYPDGTVERDSVFALYRPGEGVNC